MKRFDFQFEFPRIKDLTPDELEDAKAAFELVFSAFRNDAYAAPQPPEFNPIRKTLYLTNGESPAEYKIETVQGKIAGIEVARSIFLLTTAELPAGVFDGSTYFEDRKEGVIRRRDREPMVDTIEVEEQQKRLGIQEQAFLLEQRYKNMELEQDLGVNYGLVDATELHGLMAFRQTYL